jgi:hypothetical protein
MSKLITWFSEHCHCSTHKDKGNRFEETTLEYAPIIIFPKTDKSSDVVAVFVSQSSDNLRRIQIHIVWKNIDPHNFNSAYDLIHFAKSGVIKDIVTIEYSYATVEKQGTPLTVISDRYTSDCWETIFPTSYRDVCSWDTWYKLDGHPIFYFNTTTHGLSNENKIKDLDKIVLSDYKIYKGSKEEILKYFQAAC